ncbi:hypothetical protein [Anaeromyxobacter oryzae]|uniref:STAS/SEC14 domain-containing protein n=1 Tax=Anaeromyxobacter oryzae TaxID=2918170 RepID=A0ABN6MQ66_9BACT|nr:hypothetical protein [Anaeromyxobacter oryzae]BDG03156.1 hypothetical protein AMOR_21520 [Anaeromyxobacter oryzae]
MADRVTLTSHAGKQIVQIDFNGCTPGTFAPIIQDAQRVITASPRGAVLALTLLESVRFDPATVLEMERFVSTVQPYLKANALVGITGMKKVVFNGVKTLYRAPVELFDDATAAKAWLLSR